MAFLEESARQGFAMLDRMEAEDEAKRSQKAGADNCNEANLEP